jgi:hypothetical protein
VGELRRELGDGVRDDGVGLEVLWCSLDHTTVDRKGGADLEELGVRGGAVGHVFVGEGAVAIGRLFGGLFGRHFGVVRREGKGGDEKERGDEGMKGWTGFMLAGEAGVERKRTGPEGVGDMDSLAPILGRVSFWGVREWGQTNCAGSTRFEPPFGIFSGSDGAKRRR